MVATQSRPSKTNDTIRIIDLTVEVFGKNTNNYGAVNCCFKVASRNIKRKLHIINALEEDG